MFDMHSQQCVWDVELEPKGFGDMDVESFNDWWYRNKEGLNHLPPEICEQWIYRHWCSEYSYIHLEKLTWTLETWNTEKILTKVGIWDEGLPTDPGHSYSDQLWEELNNSNREPFLTMREKGYWNIPPIVLYSECGFSSPNRIKKTVESRPDIQYWLIEGHKRFCYLKALSVWGKCAEFQKVYVISINN